jgi:predicted hotdog family 3-hydroxylacyl-ACP dehydratase
MSHPDYPPVIELVPHRDTVLLLDRVLEHDANSTVTRVDVGAQRWMKRDDGGVAPWLAIEYMAQCIAAHAGLAARADGNLPRIGFLLGTRRAVFHCDRFEPGTTLRASAERTWGGEEGMVSFECRLEDSDSGALLAEARLNCYLPREGEELGGRG